MHLRAYHSWLCHSDYDKPIIQGDRYIEKLTGMSDRTITYAKKKLVDSGWIKIEPGKRGTSSKYWILRYEAPAQPESKVSVDVRTHKPKKYGHYVVGLRSECENTTHSLDTEKPKTIAHEICDLLANEPEELIMDNAQWWEKDYLK